MIKKCFAGMLVAGLVAVSSQSAAAQGGFQPGYLDIGPTIGLGGTNGGTAIGGRLEKAIKTLPSMGDGILGIQVGADFYSFDFGPASSDFTVFFVGATANYHLKMTDTKFDPFIGLGLGFESFSCDFCATFSSGIRFIGRVGARYFVSEKIGLYADVGAGAATLSLGAMFRLK